MVWIHLLPPTQIIARRSEDTIALSDQNQPTMTQNVTTTPDARIQRTMNVFSCCIRETALIKLYNANFNGTVTTVYRLPEESTDHRHVRTEYKASATTKLQ